MNGECWIKSLYLKERSWSKGEVGETAHQRLRYWTRLFGNEKERFAESLRGLSSVDPKAWLFLPSREASLPGSPWSKNGFPGLTNCCPERMTIFRSLPRIEWKRETAPPFSGFFKPFWRLGLGKLGNDFHYFRSFGKRPSAMPLFD